MQHLQLESVSQFPFHLITFTIRKYFLFINGYPEAFPDRCIRIFLDRLFSPPTHTPNSSDKNIVYFSIPFTGPHALHIRTQLNKLCFSALPQISLRFNFQSGRHLVWFLSFQGPNSYVTAIAYCQKIYVSMLRSIVFEPNTRISEHVGSSPLTGTKLATTLLPSIRIYSRQTLHAERQSDCFQSRHNIADTPSHAIKQEQSELKQYIQIWDKTTW